MLSGRCIAEGVTIWMLAMIVIVAVLFGDMIVTQIAVRLFAR